MGNGARGAAFERACKARLEARGWTAVRSAASKGVLDLVALKSGLPSLGVQCKTNGRLDPAEWNELIDACEAAGAVPVLARRNPKGRGCEMWRLTGRKDGSGGRQPMARLLVLEGEVLQEEEGGRWERL